MTLAGLSSVLQLAPLFRLFRQRVETREAALEESVRTLAYAADLVVLKLRWLIPGAKPQEEEASEEAPELFGSAGDETGATGSAAMDPLEVRAAVQAVEDRMRARALMFPAGRAPVFEGGRRLEITSIDPSQVRAAMLLMEKRNGGMGRTYVVSRWSFVTHLRDFWRDVRRLASTGVVLKFSRFLGGTRQEAILNFLAFLELVKRRRLFARQRVLFGDIEFSTTKGDVDGEEKGQS